MVENICIVLGLGFGDEGKGLTTDYLCKVSEKSLVVRFNGGHQAGHTVVLPNGKKHIFACFGSGTLQGISTYWSNFCTFCPSIFVKEHTELKAIGINPVIYIDNLCPVTTHYDILYNRALEMSRGELKHGSCGVGFGATIDRHESSPIKLYAQDLLFPSFYSQKLKSIRAYYEGKLEKETGYNFNDFPHDEEDINFYLYIKEIKKLIEEGNVSLVTGRYLFQRGEWATVIFEGAQGILLDKDFGVYPYVTRSNTTSKNALAIIKDCIGFDKPINVYYVTRCYSTRHGEGPFNRQSSLNVMNREETNKYNAYQGHFFKDYLDIDALNYALRCDSQFTLNMNKYLVITCLDQMESQYINCYLEESIISPHYRDIYKKIEFQFRDIYYSFSNISQLS